MKITKIVTISAFGILLSACNSNQMQVEGSAAVMDGTGAEHSHNVEGYGDNDGNYSHSHSGNSTAGHGHSWEFIKKEAADRGITIVNPN